MKIVQWLFIGLAVLLSIIALLNNGHTPPHKTDYRVEPTPTPAQSWRIGQSEILYDGHIRAIDWQHRSFIYESGWGFVKPVGPVCGNDALPLWVNMHVYEINLHWKQPEDESGCFVLDYVGHRPGVPGE